MSRQDKATTERNTKTLRELVKRPENKLCADCKRNDPRWASWNLGIFLCIRCSGIHRGMGTHISKVKSVDLDVWTPEQMQSIQKWGNHRANLYWEAHLKAGHVAPDHKMESFIRSKYESRRWAMEGPRPEDPSVLEQAEGGEVEQVETRAASPPVTPQGRLSDVADPRRSGSINRGTHSLLSTSRSQPVSRSAAASTPARAPVQAVPPPQPQNDLFSLDFHSPSTMNGQPSQHEVPKKDVKSDILSLFNNAPATAPQMAPAPMAQNPAMFSSLATQSGWGVQGVKPMSNAFPQGGDTWGSFTSAPPPQPQMQNSLFSSQDVWSSPVAASVSNDPLGALNANVWGAPSLLPVSNRTATAPKPAPLGDLFSTPFSGTSGITPAKKDDAFGDLWGFK